MSSQVFLFRDCIKRPPDEIDLRLEGDSLMGLNSSFLSASDLFGSEPKWTVPPGWCTPEGQIQMEAIGRYIAQEFLLHTTDSRSKIRLVADTFQTTVITALSLTKGIAAVLNQLLQEKAGLANLQMDDVLFRPSSSREQLLAGSTLCQELNNTVWQNELMERVQKVKTPGSLVETMEKLKAQFLNYPQQIFTMREEASIRLHGHELAGPIHVLVAYAHTILSARSSGFQDFGGDLDLDILMDWLYWFHSVTEYGNSQAAAEGAVMAEAIQRALELKDTTTIIVGKESDFMHLATALNMTWSLPGLSHYHPTPPGSVIRFQQAGPGGENVDIQFMYPEFVGTSETIAGTMKTRELGSLPGGLRPRIRHVLQNYDPAATQCLHRANQRYHAKLSSVVEESVYRWAFPLAFIFLGFSFVLLGVFCFLNCCGYKKSPRAEQRREELVEVDLMESDLQHDIDQHNHHQNENVSLKNAIYM